MLRGEVIARRVEVLSSVGRVFDLLVMPNGTLASMADIL